MPSTRVLRKRSAPTPTTPSKTRVERPAKRVKVVYVDTESDSSSSDDEDDVSAYGQDSDDDDGDKENAPAPVTPRSQRMLARRKSQPVTPTSTARRRVASTSAKSAPPKSNQMASPTKGASRKLASLTLNNSTNAPDSDSSSDSNPFVDTPDTSLDIEVPSSPSKKDAPFARARAALRACPSSTPLTGRDDERRDLLAYLRGSTPKSLYISGAPGTGKTALIREVLTAYPYPTEQEGDEEEEEEEEDVRKLYVNCVGRKEEHVWDLILDSMRDVALTASPKKKKAGAKEDGRATFERLLSASDSRCFLVLDEIDHLSPSSGVLASIFALPASHKTLRVVAISNSHTLAARSKDVATLHFAPYDAQAMREIARTRLASSSGVFSVPAIALAATRTAGVTGDVRMLVALLVRAVDFAERAHKEQVAPPHILDAFKSLQLQGKAKPAPVASASTTTTAAPAPTAVKAGPAAGLALQPKLALLALLIAKKRLAAGLGLGLMPSSASFFIAGVPSSPTKRSSGMQRTTSFSASPSKKRTGMARSTSFGGGDLDANTLHGFYAAVVARSSPLGAVSRTEFVDVLAVLEGCGCTSMGCAEVAEGVRVEDVVEGEGVEEGLLKALWDKELRRVEREVGERDGRKVGVDDMEL